LACAFGFVVSKFGAAGVDRGIPAHSRACIEAIEVLDIGADRLAGVDESQMRYFNIMRVRVLWFPPVFRCLLAKRPLALVFNNSNT